MKIDKTTINNYNKQEIISIIRSSSETYCAQIARETGLSIPCVMKITDKLIADGLVRRSGRIGTPRGKNPEILQFVHDAYYIIGVDVGTTNIVTILMDLQANIIYKYCTQTSKDTSAVSIFAQVNHSIASVYENNKAYVKKILGIGIGMAGIVNSQDSRVDFSPAFGWRGVNARDYLVVPSPSMVVVENVTKAMALGEKWFGMAKTSRNMICVNLGYGIGSALMIDSYIHIGDSHAAGELGHMVLEQNGPLCGCGNRGCLEALASANAIKNQAIQFSKEYPDSLIPRIAGDINKIEAKTVFDAAKKGDKLATEIIDKAANYIGLALANVVNLLDINLIVLEGGLAKAGDILTRKINASINRHLIHSSGEKVRLCVSDLSSDAVAIGAATIILKRFIENGVNPDLIFAITDKDK